MARPRPPERKSVSLPGCWRPVSSDAGGAENLGRPPLCDICGGARRAVRPVFLSRRCQACILPPCENPAARKQSGSTVFSSAAQLEIRYAAGLLVRLGGILAAVEGVHPPHQLLGVVRQVPGGQAVLEVGVERQHMNRTNEITSSKTQLVGIVSGRVHRLTAFPDCSLACLKAASSASLAAFSASRRRIVAEKASATLPVNTCGSR